ncbi:type II toxin-antitoxin system VapC family toxin [Lacihabitans soyangensis]|uniref:Type II toxin-antitoxin system VapC family toxin n=1 Tax=Lacihabitans soyangensis TaxID=869394 RepID=A0AAE3H840_9BACT|nr:type II toxin-antitoxin system VapC family toxin [Lacihabitans soyangensis]MCP9765796.1 type II toxin-antitoxin system VapC family toxin [Lacihabitans soyangensis]
MNKFLLDTHALIWFNNGDDRLSEKVKKIIENEKSEIFVSMASFFEITIKLKLGKLQLRDSIEKFFEDAKAHLIQILPISENHLFEYQNIPLIENHRVPFDRLIIATASFEKLSLISIDKNFEEYEKIIDLVW